MDGRVGVGNTYAAAAIVAARSLHAYTAATARRNLARKDDQDTHIAGGGARAAALAGDRHASATRGNDGTGAEDIHAMVSAPAGRAADSAYVDFAHSTCGNTAAGNKIDAIIVPGAARAAPLAGDDDVCSQGGDERTRIPHQDAELKAAV